MAVDPKELGIGQLFDRVRDAVVVADATTGAIVLWNAAAAEVFGYSEDEATSMGLDALVPPELRQAHREGLSRFARSGGTDLVHDGTVLELPALHHDGHQITVELTLTPLRTVPDRPLALAIIRDVTARTVAARALADAQQASEQANDRLREFIAALAHDLRGPLTSVGGFVRLLQGGQLAPEDQADLLVRVGRQVQHMDGIVGDLLIASQLEIGSMVVAPATVEVGSAIAEAADACGGVDGLEVNGAAGVEVQADRKHVVRCLGNYLQNAVKYGTPPVYVDVRNGPEGVEIRVRDGGEGVAEDEVWRLFDRFTRPARHATKPGLGLGLSIVRGLAEANGGAAWYEGGEGGGACFVLRLPTA